MRHRFELERRVMHGHFSRDLPAIATIDPGDSIAFPTLNARWQSGSGERPFERDPELDRGHCLFGPVEVRGAKAGETLVVTTAALMLLTAVPAMAMSCCGGAKGGMMCGKPAMAMGHGSMKKGKGGCCCEKMSMNMSKRR